MHANNHLWIQDLKEQHPHIFKGKRVLEIGSRLFEGKAVREYFDDCGYIGLDKTGGDNVDYVEDMFTAHFPANYFDVIIILSVLEHEKQWDRLIQRAYHWLGHGGHLIISWGAEGNKLHLERELGWQPVPHDAVIGNLERLGLEIKDSFFEEERYGPDCAGCYNIYGTKELDRNIDRLVHRQIPNDSDLKRVDICLMKWHLPEMELDCIRQIIENTDHPYNLRVFDTRALSEFQGEAAGINTSKIWNRFLRESTCDYVCIMDTDAFVTKGWLKEIMKVFEKHKDAGLVGPVSSVLGVPEIQIKTRLNAPPFAIDGHLSGYCFVLKREMLKDIGYYDEDYYYYGQDSDYAERILESNKWKMYICPEATVDHGRGGEWSLSTNSVKGKSRYWEPGYDSVYSQILFERKRDVRKEIRTNRGLTK